MNSFVEIRQERLSQLLQPFIDGEVATPDRIYVFVDKEVRAAYGRGFRDGQRKGGKPSTPAKPSAVKAGKLTPVRESADVELQFEEV